MGTQSSRKSRDQNQQYYNQTTQQQHSSSNNRTSMSQRQPVITSSLDSTSNEPVASANSHDETPTTSESAETTISQPTTKSVEKVQAKEAGESFNIIRLGDDRAVSGHANTNTLLVNEFGALNFSNLPCQSSETVQVHSHPDQQLPSIDVLDNHKSDEFSHRDGVTRNSSRVLFQSRSVPSSKQPDISATSLGHPPFSHEPSGTLPVLLEREETVDITDYTSRSSLTSLTEEIPEIDEQKTELPYRWYSWPSDVLPTTLMKSAGVRETFRALRGQTLQVEEEDEEDSQLLELANRLYNTEKEKKEQIQQGRGRPIPGIFVPESHQIASKQKMVEISDKKKRKMSSDLVPCAFNWSHGGHSIYLTGSFDGWAMDKKIKLVRSGHEFAAIKELPRGVHYYKFIVDDQWRFAPNQATHSDERGNVNNVLDISNYELYNFTVAKEHEQAREAVYHQFVPGSNDYTTDAPVIPMLLSKSHCVAVDPPSRISTPLQALSNHLYHDSHAAHLFGPHIASVTSTQRWRHSHKTPLSTAGLRFSTLIYVTFNPLFLLHGDANFELYAASPLRSLIFRRNTCNSSTSADGSDIPKHHSNKDDNTTTTTTSIASSRHNNPQQQGHQIHSSNDALTTTSAIIGTGAHAAVGTSSSVSVGMSTSVETSTSVTFRTPTTASVSIGTALPELPVLNNSD